MSLHQTDVQNTGLGCTPLPRKKIYRGLRYFSVFTIAGLLVIFYASSSQETFGALADIDLRLIMLAVLIQIVDIWLGAWRNHILIRSFKPNVSIWLCLKAQLANEFGAAVTPGQSGGMPAWLYTLHQGGINVPSAMAVSVLVFLSTLIFFVLSAAFATQILSDDFTNPVFTYMLRYGVVISCGLLAIILLSFWMPARLRNRLLVATSRLEQGRTPIRRKIGACLCHILEMVTHYQNSCKRLWEKDQLAVLQTFFITLLYYLGKLNLAYVILLGLGVQADYLQAMALLALLRFVLYFAPTPGGSGIGEISIVVLLSSIMPAHLLPVFAVLYRTFHLFLPAAFGAWVLVSEIRTPTREPDVMVTIPQDLVDVQH